MYKIAVDAHTHTVISGHAYCTYGELWAEAAEAGLCGFGVADHISRTIARVNGGEVEKITVVSDFNISGRDAIPRVKNGVKLYHGVEIDIVKKDGSLFGHDVKTGFFDYSGALPDIFLSRLDYAIAGVHLMDEYPLTKSEGTAMYVNAMAHPKVFILGHIHQGDIPFDIGEVAKAARDMGKAIEINEAKLKHEHEASRAKALAVRCAELGTMIAVNSDAHSFGKIGVFPKALAMLEEIGFPPELIVNGDTERFEKAINLAQALRGGD